MKHSLIVPEPFILKPFVDTQTYEILADVCFEDAIQTLPIIFDVMDYIGVKSLKPWEQPFTYVPIIFYKWNADEEQIMQLIANRNQKEALQPMKHHILSFIAALFWLNGQPVAGLNNLSECVKQLKIKPVNVEDRVAYLMSAPNHHHSFTQLKQLFIELKKKYAVMKMRA